MDSQNSLPPGFEIPHHVIQAYLMRNLSESASTQSASSQQMNARFPSNQLPPASQAFVSPHTIVPSANIGQATANTDLVSVLKQMQEKIDHLEQVQRKRPLHSGGDDVDDGFEGDLDEPEKRPSADQKKAEVQHTKEVFLSRCLEVVAG